jgi:hypothetical protein
MKLSRHFLAAFTAFSAVGAILAAAPTEAFAQEVRVVIAPPAPRVEYPTVRPGPYHVWQSGSWAWQPEGHYGWHPGRWVLPPQGRTIWARDEWVNYGGSWRFVPGHWYGAGERIVPAAQRVTVAAAPPAEQVEIVEAVPEGRAWIHGHWSWDGVQYLWVPGHTMLVPEGFHTWQPGHWYANSGHWFFANGYWH